MARTEQFELLPDIIRSRRTAWYVALIASVLCAIAILTLLLLAPLKERYAFPILVDKTTGYAVIMQTPADINNLHSTTTASLDRHWIQEYIHARESFQTEKLGTYYKRVRLMSCENEFHEFAWNYQATNPNNYYTIYQNRRVNTNVKSITPAGPLRDNHGQAWRAYNVNIDREFHNATQSGLAPRSIPYEISLAVRFRELQLEESLLRLNPLGFEVCYYERDQYLERQQ